MSKNKNKFTDNTYYFIIIHIIANTAKERKTFSICVLLFTRKTLITLPIIIINTTTIILLYNNIIINNKYNMKYMYNTCNSSPSEVLETEV